MSWTVHLYVYKASYILILHIKLGHTFLVLLIASSPFPQCLTVTLPFNPHIGFLCLGTGPAPKSKGHCLLAAALGLLAGSKRRVQQQVKFAFRSSWPLTQFFKSGAQLLAAAVYLVQGDGVFVSVLLTTTVSQQSHRELFDQGCMELKTLFACALMNIWMHLRHFLHPVESCFKPLQQKWSKNSTSYCCKR
jgi:hypothetical protein